MRVQIAPGTIVLNEDPEHPLVGEILDPSAVSPPFSMDPNAIRSGFLVRWSNGETEWEDAQDLVLTADIRLEIV